MHSPKTHELAAVLYEFTAIQKKHGNCLRDRKLKSLPGWIDQRRQVFNRLKQCLENFDPRSLTAESAEARLIQKAMEAVLSGEKNLADQVEYRRNKIRQKLQTMRKGKAVLNKYGGSRVAALKPKYLSSRM